jgi:eukaryotic-like serine/threonine-protein kinase
MLPHEWNRVKALVADAAALDAGARRAFLDRACGDDRMLRDEVVALLEAHDRSKAFLESPALTAEPVLDGTRVGPYRIVREIGRGGMGAVYLGERVDGEFEQHVAIKFVWGAHLSDTMLRRFREERRILASLDHPNIAHLLDGGTAAQVQGLPYVVMEYVDGVSIADFCETNRLSVHARVELFQAVCAAVHYAHQRLIVHRDIKAANILVRPDGTPKLLDFGIATLLEPAGDPATRTRTFLRALTPDAASPEQIRGERVTIASDVYALGVLLYRLLTRRSPYSVEAGNDAALMHAICEFEPRPPSAVVEADAAAPAAERIDRDLDYIVLKALRKEPERRYGSADQLSEDLGRYLNGQPVDAAPDSRRYRLEKFLRRHRLSVAISATALLAIVGGSAVAVYQARVARFERARAERRFNDVRTLANSFLFELHDTLTNLPGTLEARRLLVRRAAEYLDSLSKEAQGDATLQRELATANQRLGDILGGAGGSNLGDLSGAEKRYLEAVALRRALAARNDARPVDVEELARLHMQLSRLAIASGRYESGEASAAEAVSLLERLPIETGDRERRLGQLANTYQQLGFAQAQRGNHAAALESLKRATENSTALVQAHPGNAPDTARLARVAADYGDELARAKRLPEALATLGDARRRIDALIASDPANTYYQQTLVLILNNEAESLDGTGDSRAALEARSRAVSVAEAMAAASPNDQGTLIAVMLSRYSLGAALIRSGDREAGIRRLSEGIHDAEHIVRITPTNDYTLNQLASMTLERGEALLAAERQAEGCRDLRDGLRLSDELIKRGRASAESVNERPRFQTLANRCR